MPKIIAPEMMVMVAAVDSGLLHIASANTKATRIGNCRKRCCADAIPSATASAAAAPTASEIGPAAFTIEVELAPPARGAKAQLVSGASQTELGTVPGPLTLSGKKGDRVAIVFVAPGFVEHRETVELPPPERLRIALTPTPRRVNQDLEDPFR